MTGALRILGKATYVWNYKQCTKYWPLVQNVGSLSSRTSQGPISTLTGSLESHSRTHINRATKGTPMRLLFYLSGCGACVFSLSWWNRWVPTTLLELGILYFCPPRCLGPDFHIRVKASKLTCLTVAACLSLSSLQLLFSPAPICGQIAS